MDKAIEPSPQLGVLLHVAIAMILGGLIGIERELAGKPAGLRTQMLVAGVATLFMHLGYLLVGSYDAAFSANTVRSDPVRILGAIITGVSFLGAGTIFRRPTSENVEGLTTAACILFSSSIGICVALRQYVLAVGVTLLVLGALRGLGFVEKVINVARRQRRKILNGS